MRMYKMKMEKTFKTKIKNKWSKILLMKMEAKFKKELQMRIQLHKKAEFKAELKAMLRIILFRPWTLSKSP